MIRVVIVEDDDELRKYLSETVASSPSLALEGSFASAEAFMRDFQRLAPEVVIMDIHLPGISGIQCIEQVKPRNPAIQYLVCTVFEDSTHLFNALCAGATGYILKSSSEEEIVRAVRDVQAGGSPMSPQIARRVVMSFPGKKSDQQALNELSPRERELLELLAAGFRYKEIADKLFLSIETVRSYIRDIYAKLHVHSRTDAINKVYPK